MNHAWHRRRAKRELRTQEDIHVMPHVLHLRTSDLYDLGYTVRLVTIPRPPVATSEA